MAINAPNDPLVLAWDSGGFETIGARRRTAPSWYYPGSICNGPRTGLRDFYVIGLASHLLIAQLPPKLQLWPLSDGFYLEHSECQNIGHLKTRTNLGTHPGKPWIVLSLIVSGEKGKRAGFSEVMLLSH
jgi:hypothetical protein